MLGKSLVLLFATLAIASADSRINFMFYHGNTYTEYTTDTLHQILGHASFRRNTETVFFHYGANQNLGTPQVADMINAYRANGRYNFVLIHYFSMNTISGDNAVGLADVIANTLIRLFDNGYSSGFCNLVCHAMGAHICGRASRNIQNRSNFKHVVGRLTALDPVVIVNPITALSIGRLNSGDAQFVETVHTDDGLNGDHNVQGHVAFFPNGGRNQPRCTSAIPTTRSACNAVFSLTLWAESARATSAIFPALQCDTFGRFNSGVCNTNRVVSMGRITDSNLRGTFFLLTNDDPPYTRLTAFP